MRPGRGRMGSLRMVWKVLAGIEDGEDNGWLLIRADAGSLFNSFPHSFSFAFSGRLALSQCQIMRSSRVLVAYLGLN